MANRPPDHCPTCGTAVTAVETGVYRCASCEEYVFHNPVPNARVAVVDGDRVLLVEIANWARIEEPPAEPTSEWQLPGGHVELGEQPAAGAARELEEETDLSVNPTDLDLFDAVTRQAVEGSHAVVLLYAVDRADTTGTLSADSDAADARFWTPAELADSKAFYRELHDEPADYRDLTGVLERASAALGGPTG
jgi:ADP-ribose pyrophosphatase YjhB (NUDIX family)